MRLVLGRRLLRRVATHVDPKRSRNTSWAAAGVWLAAAGAILAGVVLLGFQFAGWALPAESSEPLPQFGTAEERAGAEGQPSPYAAIAVPPPVPVPGLLQISTYVVQDGDTLLALADRFGLRPESVLWANDLPNPDLIVVGEKLVIPPTDGLLYTVEPGDRLRSIVDRYGLDLFDVALANGLEDPDQLPAGLDLFLPAARPLAPSRMIAAGPNTAPGVAAGPGLAILPLGAPLPDNVEQILAAAWVRTAAPNALYGGPEQNARRFTNLPSGVRLERTGDLAGRRIPARDPGDGRTRQAMSGWLEVDDLEPTRAPAPRELPRSYPSDTRMDIFHTFVPYRGQLDGSPYATANCGPTTIGMVLESFGIEVPQPKLRAQVLDTQRMWGHGTGTLISALAQVVESYGLQTLDLRPGGEIRRWSLDDIRRHLNARHPVVVQVRYRALPGREGAYFYGDHYIVVTGVLDDGFLYNDPIDVDGVGWDRVMSGERLARAMDTSDRRYVQAGFAVSQ
jgi:LysM repeat protein